MGTPSYELLTNTSTSTSAFLHTPPIGLSAAMRAGRQDGAAYVVAWHRINELAPPGYSTVGLFVKSDTHP